MAKPWFILPLFGFCMVFATHLILNAFGALLWKEQGISETVIGPLIALGSASEVAIMFLWKRFGGRISARMLMLVSAVAAALRWCVMGLEPGVGVLIVLQLAHGITFAIGYLGCVHFIANWTREDIAAETQSLFVVCQQVLTVASVIGFGWLVQSFGAQAFFAALAMSLLGGALVWVSLQMQPAKGK